MNQKTKKLYMEAGSESRDHAISAVAEVAVKRKGAVEAQAVDQLETGAISEAEGFVVEGVWISRGAIP